MKLEPAIPEPLVVLDFDPHDADAQLWLRLVAARPGYRSRFAAYLTRRGFPAAASVIRKANGKQLRELCRVAVAL